VAHPGVIKVHPVDTGTRLEVMKFHYTVLGTLPGEVQAHLGVTEAHPGVMRLILEF
jgi:hypothetical protein